MIKKLLNSTSVSSTQLSLGLLVLRLGFGLSIASLHGYAKLANYGTQHAGFDSQLFPFAFALIMFAEFFAALAVAVGFLTRLATIPLIIGMSVATIGTGSFHEAAWLYLIPFVVIGIMGSGKYSIDALLFKNK